jgi:hypothetical protein
MGRTTYVLLGIIVLVLVCLVCLVFWNPLYAEGFELSLDENVENRFNPLAAQTNPLKNPAVAIGVSEAKGRELQGMFQAALNVGVQQADGAGSFKETPVINETSVRIDDENSFLGMVKMCKEKGAGANPFSDPAFARDCGMCISSGSLITGETFTKPTGVLVYKADKDQAISDKKTNGHKFPRAIPSLKSAQCVGASKSESALPMLAVTSEDYEAYRKRNACKSGHVFSEECGLCISTKEYSWVPKSGGIQPLTLWLWGVGVVSVLLGGAVVKDFTDVSMSAPLKISLGKVPEGTTIEISAKMKTEAQSWARQLGIAMDGPYVYGAITSPMANGGIYRLPIEKFLEKDTVSGSSIRKTDIKYFLDIKASCTKILPQPNKDSMNLQGSIPVTLVESDQLASYDCPSSPFVMSEDSAQILVNDPCVKKGQGPGNYSDECLRQTILEAFDNPSSCSTDGEWYQKLSLNFGNGDRGENRTLVQNERKNMTTDPGARRGCTGEDISTPCDSALKGGTPSNQCLVYLYKNHSEKNPRIGRAYTGAPTSYTSSSNDTRIQFCRKEGSLNPDKKDNPTGYLAAEANLLEASRGYKGQKGIEAVKLYLSDVFINAIGDTDLKNENWKKCFGIPIADKLPRQPAKNSKNDVIRPLVVVLPPPPPAALAPAPLAPAPPPPPPPPRYTRAECEGNLNGSWHANGECTNICNSAPVQNKVSRAAGDPTYLTLTGPGCVKRGQVFSVNASGDWRQSASWALWRQDGKINDGCKNPGCGFVAPNTAGTTTITYTLRDLQGKLVINVK